MEPEKSTKIKNLFFKIKNKVKEREIRRFLIGFGVVLFFLGLVFLLFPRKEAPPGPTPSPTPKPLDLETADWSNFENENLSVRLKYPADLKVVQSDNQVKFYTYGPTQ